MIDISHSMILYGEDRITPAKKVAMALVALTALEVVVLISDVKCYIPAVCVPVLTASSAVKGAVKIAEALVEKGYTLADEYTRSNPSKPLDMIFMRIKKNLIF